MAIGDSRKQYLEYVEKYLELNSKFRIWNQLMYVFLVALSSQVENFNDMLIISGDELFDYIYDGVYIFDGKSGAVVIGPGGFIEFRINLKDETGYVPTKALIAVSPEKIVNSSIKAGFLPTLKEINDLGYVVVINDIGDELLTIRIENNGCKNMYVFSVGVLTKGGA